MQHLCGTYLTHPSLLDGPPKEAKCPSALVVRRRVRLDVPNRQHAPLRKLHADRAIQALDRHVTVACACACALRVQVLVRVSRARIAYFVFRIACAYCVRLLRARIACAYHVPRACIACAYRVLSIAYRVRVSRARTAYCVSRAQCACARARACKMGAGVEEMRTVRRAVKYDSNDVQLHRVLQRLVGVLWIANKAVASRRAFMWR